MIQVKVEEADLVEAVGGYWVNIFNTIQHIRGMIQVKVEETGRGERDPLVSFLFLPFRFAFAFAFAV